MDRRKIIKNIWGELKTRKAGDLNVWLPIYIIICEVDSTSWSWTWDEKKVSEFLWGIEPQSLSAVFLACKAKETLQWARLLLRFLHVRYTNHFIQLFKMLFTWPMTCLIKYNSRFIKSCTASWSTGWTANFLTCSKFPSFFMRHSTIVKKLFSLCFSWWSLCGFILFHSDQ